jgi:cytochrome c oxidase subunit 2
MIGAAIAALSGFAGGAFAAQPTEWQIITTVMDDITWFNSFTGDHHGDHAVRAGAVALVHLPLQREGQSEPVAHFAQHDDRGGLDDRADPDPGVIAFPSFRLLYKQLDMPEYDMTIKATGYQWYWGYEYTDEGMEDVILRFL